MNDAIAEALADLERARAACLSALDDRFAMPADKLKAAAELRLIGKQRLEFLDRCAEHQDRADAGIW